MARAVLFFGLLFAACSDPAGAHSESLFVSQPNQIIRLVDRNHDGDFLDYAEMGVYADGLPAGLGTIAAATGRLYVLDTAAGRVFVVQDLNGDGDALDYGEVRLYAQMPGGSPTPAVGLVCQDDGTLLVADSSTGKLYRAGDRNQDGDALDAGEMVQIDDGLTSPTAVAVRPDGRLLLAQNLAAMPVRALFDRDADGDYFDFAESISYAESFPPGRDIVAPRNDLAYLTRPADGTIVKLYDWTGDDDALDFGEVLVYAQGLSSPYAITMDGDALDYGEVLVVATGLTQPAGIARVAPIVGCLKGDADGSGHVDFADVQPFVDILLGLATPPDVCPADMNGDGMIDGADIQLFVAALLD
jgi:hypothetical protein